MVKDVNLEVETEKGLFTGSFATTTTVEGVIATLVEAVDLDGGDALELVYNGEVLQPVERALVSFGLEGTIQLELVATGSGAEGQQNVSITVNGDPYPIHRGRRTVVEIKQVAGVPLAHDVEQVIDDTLTPLPDDGAVVVKGGEVFVSHPKDAGSSGE